MKKIKNRKSKKFHDYIYTQQNLLLQIIINTAKKIKEWRFTKSYI